MAISVSVSVSVSVHYNAGSLLDITIILLSHIQYYLLLIKRFDTKQCPLDGVGCSEGLKRSSDFSHEQGTSVFVVASRKHY